jgi:transposase
VAMETIARAAVSRREWRKRVARWKESGLTAKEFGADAGINPAMLYYWNYKLKYGDRLDKPPKPGTRSDAIVASLVEVPMRTSAAVRDVSEADRRFEVEMSNGRRVRLAAGFDPEALGALLAIVESA